MKFANQLILIQKKELNRKTRRQEEKFLRNPETQEVF